MGFRISGFGMRDGRHWRRHDGSAGAGDHHHTEIVGATVTAVVVDLDGVRQALLRGNAAPIHTLDNAYYKAYSSASLTLSRKEDSTKAVRERMAKAPATTVPQTPLPNVTYAVGGVAIMAGGNIIGGLGVSGAPGGQFDDDCARAALAKIADRMK